MSTQSLGTIRWAHRESVVFVHRFTGWFLTVFLFSLPAVAVTLALFPDALSHLVAGIVAIAISFSGISLNEFEESDDVEIGDISYREAFTFIIVMYTMLAAGYSVVLLTGIILGALVGVFTGQMALTFLVATLFPIIDNQLGRHLGHSLFASVTLVVITVYDLLSTVYRVSQSVRDEARRGRRRLIN